MTNIRNLINTFYFYAGLESLIENIDRCKSNPDKPSPTKVRSNIHSGFSISTVCSFKDIENKHDVYRGKNCVKKFREFLREHAMKKINLKKKKMKSLTKE